MKIFFFFTIAATAGIVALAVLAMFGIDQRKIIAKGPRWLRRAALAAVVWGLSAGTGFSMEAENMKNTQEWKRISEALKSPERDSLKQAMADVTKLEGNKLLTEPESRLLQGQLQVLMRRLPPPPGVTCYKPMPSPVVQSGTRLEQRLPYLEQMAASDALKPTVMLRVIQGVMKDLSDIKNKSVDDLSEDYRKKLKSLAKKTDRVLKVFEDKLSQQSHEDPDAREALKLLKVRREGAE